MAFNRKVIRLTLTLNGKDESFTSDSQNKLEAVGLRISAEINFGNGMPAPSARLRIYGLPAETMNKLIRQKYRDAKKLRDDIMVEAGDQGEDLMMVFKGGIVEAYPDYAEAPNASLIIEAQTAVLEAMTPSDAESYEGTHDVINIMGNVCRRIGYTLEDNGVKQSLENVYLCNTDISKIKWLAEAANLDLYVESGNIAVTRKGEPRKLKIPVISPDSGMIGYPVPTSVGVQFKCFYDPIVRFGGVVRIKDSIIDRCNGDWITYGVRVNLETETEGGRWFMDVSAYPRGQDEKAIKR
ncbi:TPA: hypothetical protein RG697_003814 [Morganella morganii]|nr:hypothetical protein [Morganella morganii]